MQQPPPKQALSGQGALVIDATWNHRAWCLILYRDTQGCIACWRFAEGERYLLIREDLLALRAAGYVPHVVVSDGRAAILKAVAEVLPDTAQQRCLVHLSRQAKLWLTQNPKTPAAQTLRLLACGLTRVTDKAAARAWNDAFAVWQLVFKEVQGERSYHPDPPPGSKKWWYTHKNLRRTWRLLNNAQPHLWTFLDMPGTPRTTNALEGGVNAPLKELLRRHRGWSIETQREAIAWWIFFKNQAS